MAVFDYAIVPFQVPAGNAPPTVSLVKTFVGAISGVPFTPKGWVFLGNRVDSSNSVAPFDWRIGLGATGSGGGGMSYAGASGAVLSGDNSQAYWSTNHLICAVRNSPINQFVFTGQLSNIGSGTVTIDIDATGFAGGNGGDRCALLLLGGDNFNAYSNYFQVGTGTLDVTAPGFRPTGVIGFHNGGVPSTGVIGILNSPGIAFGADGCGMSGIGCAEGGNPGGDPNSVTSYQRTDKFIVTVSKALDVADSTVSMLSNGFRIVANGLTGTFYSPYLAFTGCSVNVVNFNQGATSVPITITTPKLAIIASINKASNTNPYYDCILGIGFAGVTNQISFWSGMKRSNLPYQTDTRYNASKAITVYNATGNGASTLVASASVSFGTSAVNLNWDVNDGGNREFIMMVFGTLIDPAQPCGGGLPSITGEGIYRIVVDKRHDTIYNPYPATLDVKIP